MASNIYEDQENRFPRRLKRSENPSVTSGTVLNEKLAIPNKRIVLGTLNVNANVRKQPSRAAKSKQNVSNDGSFGQSDCSKSRSLSSGQLSVPSFTIQEDKCEPAAIPSLSTISLKEPKKCSVSDDKENKLFKFSSLSSTRVESGKCLPSPEDMDVSLSENSLMVVDTPVINREDLLTTKEEEWDVPEYAPDIYKYSRQAELVHRPRVSYMAKQTDITAGMRWILIDWLVEVADEYDLHTETLYLSVSYVDRFLSHMSVRRDKLQLIGTTAMFIASKYEEIYPPDVNQFAYITDNTYRKSQILRMEHLMLKVLGFDMAVPTPLVFINGFAKECKCSKETLHLAYFLAELSLLECDPFLRFLPSIVAAAAVALANYTQGKPVWPERAISASVYQINDFKECYINLNTAFSRVHVAPQHAMRDKYKAAKWSNVSSLTPREGFPWS